jgi:hypothetical protein
MFIIPPLEPVIAVFALEPVPVVEVTYVLLTIVTPVLTEYGLNCTVLVS